MKVFQLSNKIPYPEKDGGAIAINAVTEGLLKTGCEVKMLAMNTRKHFVNKSAIPGKYCNDRHLEMVAIDTSIKILPALKALITGKSYNISRFQSKEFSSKLIQILQQEKFDIIHLEGLYLIPYLSVIRQYSKAPVVLRTHNIEWTIWKKLASEEKNKWKKWYFNKLSAQLKKYEESNIHLVDGIATITNKDLEYLKTIGCKKPLVHIPFGIDLKEYQPKATLYSCSLFYIGALDWLPNLQGVDWFLKNVWSNIYAKFPNVQLHIAGRNMPRNLRNSTYPNVIFHGEIENAKTYMEEYDIMTVPLFAGSGVRIKIIEAMAMGKAIVTTTAGIEGIECKWGREVLVVDKPDQFAEAICQCIADATLKNSLQKNARKWAEENYDIDKTTDKLLALYNELILQHQV